MEKLSKKRTDKLLNNFYKDYPGTRFMIQQIIDDIYACVGFPHEDIIFLTPEQLELLEESIEEDILQEEICYENI